jgi:hypothetical protein
LLTAGRRKCGGRTVWLGLFLLLGIGALASFKFVLNPQQAVSSANVSLANVSLAKAAAFTSPDADPSSAGSSDASDTLTKGDRLQIVYAAPDIDVKPAATVDAPVPPPIRPATAAPKIIGRHWHDPNDRKVTQGAKQKAKIGDSGKGAPIVERPPSVEANSCKPDALQGLRQLFNTSGNCVKAN